MEHRARITWTAALVERGLPDVHQRCDPSWLPGEDTHTGDGWGLVCRYEVSPLVQGNPTLGFVSYMASSAPNHRLIPGARLCLFEPWTQQLADVEILD